MNLAKTIDQTTDHLDNVDWNTVAKELIELWTIIFKGIIVLTVGIYIAGETLGNLVHRTNDFLSHHWVRLIVPPTYIERQAPIIVEVELVLPPPLVIEDPWEGPIEVELMLPLALEPLAILFTTPPMLVAVQAPVALLAAGQDSTLQEQPATNRRPRGHKAHRKRVRRTLAA
jgi:hypothetical protein